MNSDNLFFLILWQTALQIAPQYAIFLSLHFPVSALAPQSENVAIIF